MKHLLARTRWAAIGLAGAAAAVSLSGCQQSAANITNPSLQLPQKLDVVCMRVNDANGNPLPAPVPVAANQCVPAASTNTNPAALPLHLYAVVTETRRGAVGILDLTAQVAVDIDKANPGVDPVPVGANPTDVAVTPDGATTFVSSADVNRPALYAIDDRRLLGDSTGTSPPPPLRLPEVSSCALPQPPQAIAVLRAASPGGSKFTIVAVLAAGAVPAEAGGAQPAAVVTVDPASMTPGSLAPCTVLGAVALSSAVPAAAGPSVPWPDGIPYADAGPLPMPSPGPSCPAAPAAPSAAADAEVADAEPADAGAGGGEELDGASLPEASPEGGAAPTLPPPTAQPTSMVLRDDVPLLYVGDGALPLVHVVDVSDPANPREAAPLEATSVLPRTSPVWVGGLALSPPTRDFKRYLYAIDGPQGSIMVFDVTDPTNPAVSPRVPMLRPHAELTPLQVPDRIAFSAPVAAVAFASHDWPLQLPQEPLAPSTGVLCNPNPNARPAAATFLDRGAYYTADTPLLQMIESMNTQGGTVQTLPTRLRGIFGFATLSNGSVAVIDVDDWDAPCRRPDPMADGGCATCGVTGALDVPEPDAGPGDLDPYHAPFTFQPFMQSSAVTLETFFPVSAPHRLRSNALLRNDPTSGQHTPFLVAVPQLFNATGGATGGTGATGGAGTSGPTILPTPLDPGFVDPTYEQNPTEPNPGARVFSSEALGKSGDADFSAVFPGCFNGHGPGCSAATSAPAVRLSLDDPTADQDQDWTVTYEGALPTVAGLAVDLASDDGYQTLTLSAQGAGFCADGIEDWNVGRARAGALLAELKAKGLPAPPTFPTGLPNPPSLPQWTSDYVEILDDLLPSNDPYWSLPSSANACWDSPLDDDANPNIASDRYDFCLNTFGSTQTTPADAELLRDLPIVQARNDSLRVSRFAWYASAPPAALVDGGAEAGADAGGGAAIAESTANRIVNPPDPANAPWLRAVRCCFHHQASIKVRTGGEWVAVGSVAGLLHHVTTDASGACVLSCDPRLALMNARAFDVPWGTLSPGATTCTSGPPPAFDRNSPIAMRNPMFSYVVWSGCGPPAARFDHTLTTRDLTWKFTVNGSFSPLSVSLVTQGTTNAVSPQSMRFIAPLGQMAVVDAESQGLVLIDLNLVAVSHSFL